jgi:hypothetical protein
VEANPLGSGPVEDAACSVALGDPTVALALDAARRRCSADVVRLCASHCVIRLQPFDAPGYSPYFRLFGLVTAGRDTGSFRFETAHLLEHVRVYLRIFRILNAGGFALQRPLVEFADMMAAQRNAAEQRTRFEQAVFRVRAYVEELKITPPESFISYDWGVPEHERWVEKRLASDLRKAGIQVVLDRWHSAQIGASVARFVERIEKSDRIVMVGTPLYRRKYENKDSSTGYVVAVEVDLISNRLLGPNCRS